VALVACAVLLLGSQSVLQPTVARASTSDEYEYYAEGFDTCQSLSDAQLSDWWSDTPIYTVGLYLGGEDGANVGCTGLGSSLWSYALSLGYGIEPFWYGAQMPQTVNGVGCGGEGGRPAYVSLNTATAYSQGAYEAAQAVGAAGSYPIPYSSVIYLDLEGFVNNSGCLPAAEQFVYGWDVFMADDSAYLPGLYGSSCSSYLTSMAGIPVVPTAIAPDDPNVDTTGVYGLQCLSDGLWDVNQRIHQDISEVQRTFNGATLTVDEDCTDGPVIGINGGQIVKNCNAF
jgi:hypothetical protein